MVYRLQSPDDIEKWARDWEDEYLDVGETIASRQWTIDPDDSPTLLANATSATVTVSGLAAGTVYLVCEEIVTSNGRTAKRCFTIRAEGF